MASREGASVEFVEPRDHIDLDVEGNVRLLPRNAKCKGAFFQYAVRRVEREAPGSDVFRAAGVERRTFLPFLEYPYADLLRISAAAAGVLYPGHRAGYAMREMGRHAYDVLFESDVGKALLRM